MCYGGQQQRQSAEGSVVGHVAGLRSWKTAKIISMKAALAIAALVLPAAAAFCPTRAAAPPRRSMDASSALRRGLRGGGGAGVLMSAFPTTDLNDGTRHPMASTRTPAASLALALPVSHSHVFLLFFRPQLSLSPDLDRGHARARISVANTHALMWMIAGSRTVLLRTILPPPRLAARDIFLVAAKESASNARCARQNAPVIFTFVKITHDFNHTSWSPCFLSAPVLFLFLFA
jgi:hypothetical protein